MEEKSITNVSDYMKMVEGEIKGYNPSSIYLYRGESRTDYKLIPSVYRRIQLGDLNTPLYLSRSSERGILSQFIRDAASYITNTSIEDKFTWLEYAQHFGVPTRLMDWTTNPLVALYFSCCSNIDADGKVYLLKESFYKQLIRQQGRNRLGNNTLKEMVEKMIWEDMNREEGFPYPIPFVPYYVDKRMNAQSSWFLVWGNKAEPLDEMIHEMEQDGKARDDYRSEDKRGVMIYDMKEDTALTCVIIPKSAKNQLLHDLDRLGINHSTLFPGLDGIGKTIEWRYNKRNDLGFHMFY